MNPTSLVGQSASAELVRLCSSPPVVTRPTPVPRPAPSSSSLSSSSPLAPGARSAVTHSLLVTVKLFDILEGAQANNSSVRVSAELLLPALLVNTATRGVRDASVISRCVVGPSDRDHALWPAWKQYGYRVYAGKRPQDCSVTFQDLLAWSDERAHGHKKTWIFVGEGGADAVLRALSLGWNVEYWSWSTPTARILQLAQQYEDQMETNELRYIDQDVIFYQDKPCAALRCPVSAPLSIGRGQQKQPPAAPCVSRPSRLGPRSVGANTACSWSSAVQSGALAKACMAKVDIETSD